MFTVHFVIIQEFDVGLYFITFHIELAFSAWNCCPQQYKSMYASTHTQIGFSVGSHRVHHSKISV
jgi:hypothetical protein